MAITVTNIEKYITFGRVYIGCAVPPPGHSLFEYASGGVPSGGTDVGATQGETIFTYKPTVEGVEIEQSAVPVAAHITAEEATLSFTCTEATASIIKAAIGSGGVQGTVTGTGAGTVIRFGGITAVTGQCVAVIGEQQTNRGKYVGGMLYNAINDAGLERPFKRGKETLIKFTFKSFPSTSDLSRAAGEQVGQWAEES